MIRKLFFALFLINLGTLSAQELNCQISIITDAKLEVTTTEQEALKQLEEVIFDFMNTTQWTKDKFKIEERINCNLQLQINNIPSQGTFSGSLQVLSSRPAFNSSYNSLLFNFQDNDIVFGFSRNTALYYTKNTFRDNLSSILAFYAYFVIGMDYDSFAPNAGTPYFVEAQQIVVNAQTSGAPGWKASETGKRNRFWLVDNVLQQLFQPLRDCNYVYHRKGMDQLYDDKDKGVKEIYKALLKLKPVVQTRPNTVNIINFVYCKTAELKSLLSDSDLKEKTDFVNLLKRLDPGNSSKFQEILN
ncbi:MAG: DUF4835 family protein [Crocinitomicaceae bacterium]|tara:strand:- start:2259 stop:3164 length:906 start_codon:yes stop_codon:yes gene_type:complete